MRGRNSRTHSAGMSRWARSGDIAALMRWQDAIILSCRADRSLVASRAWAASIRQVAARGLACAGRGDSSRSARRCSSGRRSTEGRCRFPRVRTSCSGVVQHCVAVLFSYWHGLFTWTPVVAVAVAGLAFLWRRDRLVFGGRHLPGTLVVCQRGGGRLVGGRSVRFAPVRQLLRGVLLRPRRGDRTTGRRA